MPKKSKQPVERYNTATISSTTTDHVVRLENIDATRLGAMQMNVKELQFKHLFFISMLRLLENTAVPEDIRADVDTALPLLSTVLKNISVETKDDSAEITAATFALHNLDQIPRIEERNELGEPVVMDLTEAQKSQVVYDAVWEQLNKKGVIVALRMAVLMNQRADTAEEVDPTLNRLFANSKALGADQFGIPKFFADNLNKVIKAVTPADIERQHKANKRPLYRVIGKSAAESTEVSFEGSAFSVRTAEQFTEQLLKVKNAKTLLTFCALWKKASMQDSPTFKDVPISDLMSLVLTSGKKTNFSMKAREDFSKILIWLGEISITAAYEVTERNPKTGKSKTVLRKEPGVRLLKLLADYSLKKEFQNVPPELRDIGKHYHNNVITKFSGELLPDSRHLFGERASVYFDSLLQMDAQRDSQAVLLGFTIQTRFNQKVNKAEPIELDRGFLVDFCEYNKTDKDKASAATKLLRNVFDKLVSKGIISHYTGLTNRNADRVTFYPPALTIAGRS